jgi:hypothetical protein
VIWAASRTLPLSSATAKSRASGPGASGGDRDGDALVTLGGDRELALLAGDRGAAVQGGVLVVVDDRGGLEVIADEGEAGDGGDHHDWLSDQEGGLDVAALAVLVEHDGHHAEGGEVVRQGELDLGAAVAIGAQVGAPEGGLDKILAGVGGVFAAHAVAGGVGEAQQVGEAAAGVADLKAQGEAGAQGFDGVGGVVVGEPQDPLVDHGEGDLGAGAGALAVLDLDGDDGLFAGLVGGAIAADGDA